MKIDLDKSIYPQEWTDGEPLAMTLREYAWIQFAAAALGNPHLMERLDHDEAQAARAADYADALKGQLLGLINSSDLLEIAVNQGRASDRMRMENTGIIGTPVTVMKSKGSS